MAATMTALSCQELEPMLQAYVDGEFEGHDQAQVQRWFAGQVDFDVDLPSRRNLSVSVARLSHVLDRDAAYVVYSWAPAHRVSLFVFDDPPAGLERGMGGRRAMIDDREVLL